MSNSWTQILSAWTCLPELNSTKSVVATSQLLSQCVHKSKANKVLVQHRRRRQQEKNKHRGAHRILFGWDGIWLNGRGAGFFRISSHVFSEKGTFLYDKSSLTFKKFLDPNSSTLVLWSKTSISRRSIKHILQHSVGNYRFRIISRCSFVDRTKFSKLWNTSH